MHGNDDVLARLQQAGKSYGKVRALDGLDLSLHAGQVTSLLGANGAGKTPRSACCSACCAPTPATSTCSAATRARSPRAGRSG